MSKIKKQGAKNGMDKLKKINISQFKTVRKFLYSSNENTHYYTTVDISQGTQKNRNNLQTWITHYNQIVDFFNDESLRESVNVEKFCPSFSIVGPMLSAEKYVKDMTTDEYLFALQKYNQRYKNGNVNYFRISLDMTQDEFLKKYPGNKYAIYKEFLRWYSNQIKLNKRYEENPNDNSLPITEEQYLLFQKILDFCNQNHIQQVKKNTYTKDYAYALIDYYNNNRKNKNVCSAFPCVYSDDMKKYVYKGKAYNIGLFLRSLRISYSNKLGVTKHNKLTSGYLTDWSKYENLANILEINGVGWKTKRILRGEEIEKLEMWEK